MSAFDPFGGDKPEDVESLTPEEIAYYEQMAEKYAGEERRRMEADKERLLVLAEIRAENQRKEAERRARKELEAQKLATATKVVAEFQGPDKNPLYSELLSLVFTPARILRSSTEELYYLRKAVQVATRERQRTRYCSTDVEAV